MFYVNSSSHRLEFDRILSNSSTASFLNEVDNKFDIKVDL